MWAGFPRWARWLAALLATIVLGVWVLPWGLSRLVSSQLPPRLSQALGRPVSLGRALVEPWRGTVTLTDLRIGPAPGQTGAPLLTLGQTRATLRLWASLRHRAPVVDSLQVQGPQLHLTRHPDGRTSVDDLIQRFSTSAPQAKPEAPARWALYNLQLEGGALQIDDEQVGQRQQIDDLSLGLPFLSNLPVDVAVTVLPKLGMRWNGRPVQASAQALPFSPTRDTRLALRLDGLDLQPFAAYLPTSLPLRLRAALLDSRLTLDFKQDPQGRPDVTVSGDLVLRQVALDDTRGQSLASWDRLHVAVLDAAPLARRLRLGDMVLTAPVLALQRDAQARWNVQQAQPAQAEEAAGSAAPAPAPVAVSGKPSQGWQVSLNSFKLTGGRVAFADLARGPAALYTGEALQLQVGPLHWPMQAPSPVAGSGQLRQGQQAIGRWRVEGEASPSSARLTLRLDELALAAAQPYLQPVLAARLAGQLSVEAALDWSDAPGQTPHHIWQIGLAQLDGLSLSGPGLPSARITRMALRDTQVDLQARRLMAGTLQVDQARASLARLANGQLDIQRWWHSSADLGAAPKATGSAPPGQGQAPAWQLALKAFKLQRSALQLTDWAADARAASTPVQLHLSALQLSASPLAWPLRAGQPAARLALDTRMRAGDGGAGAALQWQGSLRWLPWRVQGRIKANGLPVHLVDRYAGTALGQLMLAQAEAGGQARIDASEKAEGWQVDAAGDLQLGQWQLHLRPPPGGELDNNSQLLGWQDLRLSGLHLTLAPGAKPSLALQSASLQDLYARLVITEQGRLNLLDARGNTVATPGQAAASAPQTVGAHNASVVAPPTSASTAPPGPAATAGDTGTGTATSLPITLDIGGVTLRNGRIDFSDRFIRPNYSVELTALDGQLGRFRSDSSDMASLTLAGRAAGTALLDIQGQFNPAARPPALDIRARATDLELAPLSPYAGKYAGYAIERGKLSMDVHYKIDPAGRLSAENQVILNQLTFGERVESPDATKLPVLLAVALLKDSKGVIDINLPISGSLDDPQFSVGALVLKVIGNLLAKAITAPFALLSGGGGGPDLSQVGFVPGTSRLTEAGTAVLAKVAQALLDRPALTLSITGSADLRAEASAYRSAVLNERLLAERRRGQTATNPPAPAASAPSAPAGPVAFTLPEAERQRLLAALYRQAPLPDKPRHALGQLQALPAAEMSQRLVAAIAADDNALRALALQRAVAVRDALVARGLPASRLFLAAPKLHQGSAGADAGTGTLSRSGADEQAGAWQPRAELSLSLP